MSRPNLHLALIVTACLASAAGCGKSPSTSTAEPRRSTTEYPLTGIVRNVDASAGRVTIRHDEIPGFMDAMTMPFTLKNPKDLDKVRPGDKVEATLLVMKSGQEVEDYELKNLVVTEPAPQQPLTLNLSGDRPHLTATPAVLKPGEMVPDFSMTASDGSPLKLSDFRGKEVALTFIFTRCPLPEFCPRMDRKFAELADRIEAVSGRAEKIRLLSVSFDPEHDTPEVLEAHAKNRGAKRPLWTFAVAPHAELNRVAPRFGLMYGPVREGINHNLVIALIDAEGRLIRLETGTAAQSCDSAELLKSLYSHLSSPR